MEDKVKLLLERIHLNPDNYSFFEHAHLEKIIINRQSGHWQVLLTLPEFLPVTIYEEI